MRWTLGAAAGGVAVALLGQAAPPLHVPTHLFSQGFGIVVALAVLERTARHAQGHDPDESVWTGLSAGCVAGLGAWGTLWLFNLGHGCELHHASTFFWANLLPLVAVAAVLGAMLGELDWDWKRRLVAVALLVAGCVVHDLSQFVLGLHGMDPLLGPGLALQQRIAMDDLSAGMVLHRLWLAVAAGATWQLWRASRGRSDWRPGLLLGLVALGTVLFGGSRVGLGLGEDAASRVLTETYQGNGVLVRYQPGTAAEVLAPAAARAAQVELHTLSQRMGGATRHEPVVIRLFASNGSLRSLTGTSAAHAHPGSIDITVNDVLDETLGHELAHVVDPGSWWVLNRGWIEGFAMAYSDGFADDASAHLELASLERIGRLPPLQSVFSTSGFWTLDEGLAYRAAGSFLGFVYLTQGQEAFVRVVSERSLASLGRSLPELDTAWRDFLRDVPVPLTDQARARERFDPVRAPAFADRQCPKLGSLVLDPRRRAEQLASAGGGEAALGVLDALQAAEPDEKRWKWLRVSVLQRLERHSEALAVLDTLSVEAPDQRLRHINAAITSAVAIGDWARLYAGFDARRALEPSTPDRERVEGLLRDPSFRDELTTVLTPDIPSWAMGRGLRTLAGEHPDRDALQTLAWTRQGFVLPGTSTRPPTGFTRAELALFEDGVRLRPDLCPLVSEELIASANGLWVHGDIAGSASLVALLERCTLPENRWRVERLQQRLAFPGSVSR